MAEDGSDVAKLLANSYRKAITEEQFKEMIEAAHRAGQHNQGHCDPSVYEAMVYYEREVKKLVIPDVIVSLPPDVAEKILKARDSFVEKDYDEVWHWLYSIASPNFDKTEPWKDLERVAGRL
jgi:hypothetical protein